MDIYEFSKKLGLAPSTISKALNNYAGVSPKTRDKIKSAALEFGYMPNFNAKSIKTKKPWLIGAIMEKDLDILHPHFGPVLQAFRQTIEQRGYDLVWLSANMANEDFPIFEHCLRRNVEGIFLATGEGENHKQLQSQLSLLISRTDIRFISVNEFYDNVAAVISDNHTGAILAMRYLYSLGHRKIAHIAAPIESRAGNQRNVAYTTFMKENNQDVSGQYTCFAKGYTYKDGYDAAKQLMNQCWNDMPTAVFAAYDELAAGAMTALKENDFLIPNDISIIGFDDLPIAACQSRELTTVTQNRHQIGVTAAQLLLDAIELGVTDSKNVMIPTVLNIRKSCKRLKTV